MREELNFINNEELERFELEVEGSVSYLTYKEKDGIWKLPHTFVPPSLGGRGIGKELLRRSLDYIRSKNGRIIPICSFAISFVDKNTEYRDMLI